MRIGIWLPVYGGWLRTIDQPAEPDVSACLAIAQQAEAMDFDFLYASENLLNCIHGPQESVADAWTLLAAIAAGTSHINLVGAVKPGFRSPLLVARMIDTLTRIAGRRLGMNVVCGWWRQEFDLSGVEWLDHAKRYRRAESFLQAFGGFFNPPAARPAESDELAGDRGAYSRPSYGLDVDAFPEIWASGHSAEATRLAAEWCGHLFLNGMSDDALVRHIGSVQQVTRQWNRTVSIALNAYVIAAETRDQALRRREMVIENRDIEKIAFFRDVMEESDSSAWAGLNDLQMVDSNSGFDAGLIGSFEDVRERLVELAELGVDTIVCQFDDPMRDAGPFMKQVIRPLRVELAERVDAFRHVAGRDPMPGRSNLSPDTKSRPTKET
ncbi:MAG: LLM class flavin-dependent oxidoreductase [Alphaproteobacteria bacterium]